MQCRTDCGACCVAPSITESFFGMPSGKPAGLACLHLTSNRQCALFGDPRRPDVCAQFLPEPAVCGDSREEALALLNLMETATSRV
ncbi:MAG: hypothetical protein CME55_07080 [Halieaceae bacterium]|nr:hypothetical protein [Halieaceae bacterium]